MMPTLNYCEEATANECHDGRLFAAGYLYKSLLNKFEFMPFDRFLLFFYFCVRVTSGGKQTEGTRDSLNVFR